MGFGFLSIYSNLFSLAAIACRYRCNIPFGILGLCQADSLRQVEVGKREAIQSHERFLLNLLIFQILSDPALSQGFPDAGFQTDFTSGGFQTGHDSFSQSVVKFDTIWALSTCSWCCQHSIASSIVVSAAIQCWPQCWAAGAASFAGGAEWAGSCPRRVLLNRTTCNVVDC